MKTLIGSVETSVRLHRIAIVLIEQAIRRSEGEAVNMICDLLGCETDVADAVMECLTDGEYGETYGDYHRFDLSERAVYDTNVPTQG